MITRCLSATEVCRHTLALQQDRGYHIAACWREDSFRQSEGQPMTLRRAAALNAVLDQCELPILPGELLLGSGIGRRVSSGEQAELDAAYAYLAPIGSRSFLTGFDHAAPDYPTLLHLGICEVAAQAQDVLLQQTAAKRLLFLSSVLVALDGAAHFIRRWADAAELQAQASPDWAELLTTQASMLRRLASEPPQTFWEAMQLVLLVHNMYQLDERYAMALGRLDQYLYPFYQADLAAGRLTPEEAQTLLDHLFAKLASGWDIQNIALGGVDAEGNDATNEVSFMCLEAVKRIGQPGGNVTARINKNTPEAFLHKCGEAIRTGIGFPALFNDEEQIPALVAQGYPLEDARNYCFVGCIEIYIPGKSAPWSDSRFNLLRCVNLALRDGWDDITGAQAGPHTGEPQSWDEFYSAFRTQMRTGIHRHVEELNAIMQQDDDRADELTSPLLSAFFADCIARGLDLCAGGAVYPANHGIAGMGIGSTADALMAVKRFVYDQPHFTLAEMRQMLEANFAGYETARRLLMKGAPKYGNDDEDVDTLAVQAARDFAEEVLSYHTPRGGQYWGLLAANVQNVSSGREVGATPDGRLALQPLSDAASPTFGRDENGPTAVVRSIAKIDYRLVPGGNVVNMKFHPSALAGEEGLVGLAALVRTCFALGGIQLQFNTTDRDMLRQAMTHPEDYRHLVVRVSGFSSYFTTLERAVQEDILARTEHAFV